MRKKTTEEYIQELSNINTTISVIGPYGGKEKPITVKCMKCGYVWSPRAGTLFRGYGCPSCAGNAPKTTQQFKEELDSIRNDITIIGDYNGANTGILVRCNSCGKEWTPTPSHLLSGRGCPECAKATVTKKRVEQFIAKSGSLADCFPELMKEWNYEENDKRGLNPHKLTSKSNHSASWICLSCGYVYNANINNRTRSNSGCPVCAGKLVVPGINDLPTIAPELMEDWDTEENEKNAINPQELSKGSSVDAYWCCHICRYKWSAKVYSRIAGSGCPRCAREAQSSLPEQTILFYMKQIDPQAIGTYQPDWIRPSEIDVFLPSLNFGIEYDGEGFHTGVDKDAQKDILCRENGIRLLHVREPKCPEMENDNLVYKRKDKKESSLDEMITAIVEVINHICNTDFSISPFFSRDRNAIYNQYLTKQKQNSISTLPEAMQDWDWEKNTSINPVYISRSSNIRVWWKCHICGHESYGMVSDHQAHKCAVCGKMTHNSKYRKRIIETGRKDVQALLPQLAEEWLPELNNGATPNEYSYQSGKRIVWKCKTCGNTWKSSIANRVNGNGCPQCSGKVVNKGENDLATLFPALIEQWVECVSDTSIGPDEVLPGSNKKVRWRCPVCHGEWIASVNSRTRNNRTIGCRYCLNERVLPGYNDLKTISPVIAAEWDYDFNGNQKPELTLNKSSYKAHWKCSCCGHRWEATVNSRTGKNHSGCPECAKKGSGKQFVKPVLQYSMDGAFLQEFASSAEAAKAIGVSRSALCNALKRVNGSCGGYRWKHKDSNSIILP